MCFIQLTDVHPWTGVRMSSCSPASLVPEPYGQAVAWGETTGMWMVANNFSFFFFWVCRHVGFDQMKENN